MPLINPFEEMLRWVEEAERKRFRITHWEMNQTTLAAIAEHPMTQHLVPGFGVGGVQRFLGIPVRIVQPGGPDGILRPAYEMWGERIIVFDIEGDLIHGDCDFRLSPSDSLTTTVTA
ncbi:hypothetical protein [Sphingobium sp. MK2]|uniref:hypothetical protein n=1 Tax=Sphingobium sp. MK2 TaxID=3116540 RepID=UPI0032E363AA